MLLGHTTCRDIVARKSQKSAGVGSISGGRLSVSQLAAIVNLTQLEAKYHV